MQLVNKEMLDYLYKIDGLEDFLNGRYLRVNEMNGAISNLDYQNYPVVINTIYDMYKSGKYPNIEKVFEKKLFLLLEKDDEYGTVDKVDVYSAMNLLFLQLKNEHDNKAPFKLKNEIELLEKLKNTIQENRNRLQNFTTKMNTNMYEDLVRINNEMIENNIPSVIRK